MFIAQGGGGGGEQIKNGNSEDASIGGHIVVTLGRSVAPEFG
jgi:hypothetical protein